MQNGSTDLSAKLLATENINVVCTRAKTASFDIINRTLTLPQWKDMTPEIEQMLVGHEVGHALYTTEEYLKPVESNRRLMGYLNVIEDVRIEKLIKRKYPGMRKHMNEGYKQLNERDFFGVKTIQNFDELLLIDKINLYFKVGFNCGIKFTAKEKEFVTRADRCETIQEVITLAQEIYEYSKEMQKKLFESMVGSINHSDSENDPQEGIQNLDYISADDYIDNKNSKSFSDNSSFNEDELESKTDRMFQSKLDELADCSTEYHYWKLDDSNFDNYVVGFKQILKETLTPEQWNTDQNKIEYETFKLETARTVNYLVKEFEMKKSAMMYKRAKTSKIGSLDMKKVYAYKIKEDLFKRVTSLPQGKNHGMVMLLDWSGSMNNVLNDTLKQVINLAQFCSRIQIPYRVYAFTTMHSRVHNKPYTNTSVFEGNYIEPMDRCSLLELFSSKMTTSEFNSMTRRLLDRRFTCNPGYLTGGTPLNESLVWIFNNLGKFIKDNNIEKTTLITLTDGGGHALSTNKEFGLTPYRADNIEKITVKQKHFICDEKTQKTYQITNDPTQQTNTFLNMIKDRYNVAIVGFYICRNTRRELISAIMLNVPNYYGNADLLIGQWRRSFKENNFASVKNTARDELFIIPQDDTKIVENELDINANANARTIAKNFGKYLNIKKTSRVLLNRFVALIA